MPLEIIPAIDLRNGQAVRLQQGAFGTAARVAEDPVKVAQRFEAEGAQRIHVVDLDGARIGSPQNVPTIRAILRKVNVPVQVGGGLRTPDLVQRIADLGADRFVVGTSAAIDAVNAAEILARFGGDKIVIGADARDGFIAVQGWTQSTGEAADAFGRRLVQMGARRFLFTDIARDGMLEGVNAAATEAFARAVGVPVIASGGVAGPEDISTLAALAQPDGIEGVIIGKALYAGRLTLADALRLASGSGQSEER
jgi:phosphoribosylformimino-5-aminoimidazole carboxamide ribotide isomerase